MIDQSVLDRGERLLWSEAPRPAQYAIFKALWTSVGGLVWLGLTILFMQQSELPSRHRIPFVLVGIALVLSPAWYFLRALRTTYLLTDRRAIIDTQGIFPRRMSVPLHEIKFVEQRQSAGGTGSVLFRETHYLVYSGTPPVKDGFIAIVDPVRIEKMLRAEVDKAVVGRRGD